MPCLLASSELDAVIRPNVDMAPGVGLYATRCGTSIGCELDVGQLGRDLAHSRLGVPEEHARLGIVVELVFDAGKAGVHRALDHDHGLAVADLEDRHSVDG